jgi:hypothetical protein
MGRRRRRGSSSGGRIPGPPLPTSSHSFPQQEEGHREGGIREGRKGRGEEDDDGVFAFELDDEDDGGEGLVFEEDAGESTGKIVARNANAADAEEGEEEDDLEEALGTRLGARDRRSDGSDRSAPPLASFPAQAERTRAVQIGVAASAAQGVAVTSAQSHSGGEGGSSVPLRPIIGSLDHGSHDNHVSWGSVELVEFAQLLPVNHGRSKKAKKKAARMLARQQQIEADSQGTSVGSLTNTAGSPTSGSFGSSGGGSLGNNKNARNQRNGKGGGGGRQRAGSASGAAMLPMMQQISTVPEQRGFVNESIREGLLGLGTSV